MTPPPTSRPVFAAGRVILFLLASLLLWPAVIARAESVTEPAHTWSGLILQALAEHLGELVIAALAVGLAYTELKRHRQAAEAALTLERERFLADKAEREEIAKFDAHERERYKEPAAAIAKQVAEELIEHPDWARKALEAAKLLPYTQTLFGERSQHFHEEKETLADRFLPYLLKRCKRLASEGRHVFLLIDAGTTLYPFFERIGIDAMKRSQHGEEWLDRLHLVTNNLAGIEQLIKSGRRVPWDRYSGLAIKDCHLLPGVPMPVFAAVAGDETNEAIRRLKKEWDLRTDRSATFVALVVGNWVRVRGSEPSRVDEFRCPVPMARGEQHRAVKEAFVECADEIFVISPLGKMFVGHTTDAINKALGLTTEAEGQDPEAESYREVAIRSDVARRVKLISTTRSQERILYRHSCAVEDSLGLGTTAPLIDTGAFANCRIEDVPHLMFPFDPLPKTKFEELTIEFPHYRTRSNREVLDMFRVAPDVFA